MNIVISEKSNVPIYEQIIHQIKDGIINRQLEPDEMLPSIRSLAKDLQISVITTKRAYEELEKEGMIYSVPQKGFFVSPRKLEILKEKRLQMIEEELCKVIKTAKQSGLSLEEFTGMTELLWEEN